MPTPTTPQQRRAADRLTNGGADREGLLRILFVGLLVTILGGFGWWYWRYETGAGVVDDSAPAWTLDSRSVVFSSKVAGKSDLYVVDLTGRDRKNLTQTSQSNESHPAFAPNGNEIAFDTDRDGNWEIYKSLANGDGAKALTTHPAEDRAPSWSPDGRWIVFMSTRDNPEFDVYRMDADGKNVQRLTTGSAMYPQFAPDGAQIAMQIARDIYVLSLKTGQLRRLTHEPANGMRPTWSSDASQLAFMSWRNGRTELFTAKAGGIDPQMLVSMPSGDAVDPRWSPDGQRIAFVHLPGGGVANARAADQQRIVYIVDVKTRRLTRLSR